MHRDQFDRVARSLARNSSRRRVAQLAAMLIAPLAGLVSEPDSAEGAKRKRRRGKQHQHDAQLQSEKKKTKKKKCKPPTVKCGKTCIDTRSDRANCGSCGKVCAAGQACAGGTCNSDPALCGNTPCASDETCVAGACCAAEQVCGAFCCRSDQNCFAADMVCVPKAVRFTPVAEWGAQGNGQRQFNAPRGVALDGDGNIFVADTGNHRIQKLKSDGSFDKAWGEQGSGNSQFNGPWAVAVSSDGKVLVADKGNRIVKIFDNNGNLVGSIGKDNTKGPLLVDPVAVAVSANGIVYVTDFGLSEVISYRLDGSFANLRWGGVGTSDGKFQSPNGLAVDKSNGDVYVVDTDNFRIQRFDAAGGFETKWGRQATDTDGFSMPIGATVDHDGSIYISDRQTNRVTKFSRHNQLLAGHAGGSLGPGDGTFLAPTGIAVTPDFTTYVVDSGNHRIRVFKQEPA